MTGGYQQSRWRGGKRLDEPAGFWDIWEESCSAEMGAVMLFQELNRGSCKTYVVGCEKTRKAALIDPLRERVDRYLAFLAYHGFRLELTIDTHTHADHRTGTWDLRELTGARTVMHERAPAPKIDVHVGDGDRLAVGEIELSVLSTPGHSADAVSLYLGDRVLT